MNGHKSESLIAGIAHVNLTIPRGTLDQAFEFYGETLGLISGENKKEPILVAYTISDGLQCPCRSSRKERLHGQPLRCMNSIDNLSS
jgi:4-hydroxyphenylpyruvate dioxygenase-like putative hemolysin